MLEIHASNKEDEKEELPLLPRYLPFSKAKLIYSEWLIHILCMTSLSQIQCPPLTLSELAIYRKRPALTGNLHFSTALHYSTHSVSHNAAVVASMRLVQRGDQVPNGHTQHKVPLVIISMTDSDICHLGAFIPHTRYSKLIKMFHWAPETHLKWHST